MCNRIGVFFMEPRVETEERECVPREINASRPRRELVRGPKRLGAKIKKQSCDLHVVVSSINNAALEMK